jgi:hypothetical protein
VTTANGKDAAGSAVSRLSANITRMVAGQRPGDCLDAPSIGMLAPAPVWAA